MQTKDSFFYLFWRFPGNAFIQCFLNFIQEAYPSPFVVLPSSHPSAPIQNPSPYVNTLPLYI